ncbi:MAG: porin, partial [Burkholderiaceae bacterium]
MICESLLAIAIAAAVPAVASAQVTVGGIMDGGFSTTTVKTGSEVTVNQTGGNASGALASNRLFFRGTEKIGNMTAGFHYELGMNAGGTGDLSTTGGVRMSIVSLAGGFGEVRIGRDYTPIFSLSCSLDSAS